MAMPGGRRDAIRIGDYHEKGARSIIRWWPCIVSMGGMGTARKEKRMEHRRLICVAPWRGQSDQ